MSKIIRYGKKALKKLLHPGGSKNAAVNAAPVVTRDQWPLEERIEGAMSLFEQKQGYRFDIDHPVLFTEKVIWYKLFYDRKDLIRLVDKYLFKDYIAEHLGEGYTIPLLGVWDNIDSLEKDWDSLPEEFCLKSTLQSDGYFIKMVHEKSRINFSDVKAEFVKWLRPEKTLINSFCRAYYGAVPRIIAEEYKTEINDQLYDYKVFCFNGEPAYVYVATDHFPGQLSHISFYDLNWNRMDVQYGSHPNCDVEKPADFDEMIRIAKQLSADFPFIRVDFFDTQEKLYVAELTLYPGGGQTPIHPESFNKELGDRFVLPEITDRSSL
ncbi:MAG: ATP-grasp fold amidoligase family protein [Erysipelotrichaceae bacterium]|nr:ATP-grasp fold amidoligase family protein [Erysipelotrichaceae bacterium]